MKVTYKQRIFGYFLFIFILFASCVVFFQQEQEKKSRIANLESRLDGYAEMIHEYIRTNNLFDSGLGQVHLLTAILPDSIRLSVIDEEGEVLFDNEVADKSGLSNHLDRPEVRNARYSSYGSNIRMSASTQHEYMYYARYYDGYYVRVALPYTADTQKLLKTDKLFVYLILVLFVIVLILINYVSDRFGKSMIQLRNFASRIKEGDAMPEQFHFPDDELGEVGDELTGIFVRLQASKKAVEAEKEKLIRHFQFSGEGICIYNLQMQKVYSNTNFIQYLNLIIDKPTLKADDLFENKLFKPVVDFLSMQPSTANHSLYQLNRNGKVFSVQTVLFDDRSFEVIIKDITEAEKNRLLKQEMTSNIAHELRTPVTSLRGYLETINNSRLTPDKQKHFTDRAYLQTIRLSNLIDDVSIISKIEEAPSQFKIEKINLHRLIEEVRIDLTDKLQENKMQFHSSVRNGLIIKGNYTLLYAIFRNLVDNSISYAGQNTEIHIDNYMEDENRYYFSYYDTGVGIEEKHMSRIFERFYRVGEGRTRDTGGSGLGLSIVKNAILFHRGDIQVKNHIGGGLEFLFTLKKEGE